MTYVFATLIFALICLLNYNLSEVIRKIKKDEVGKATLAIVSVICIVVLQVWLIANGLMYLGFKF